MLHSAYLLGGDTINRLLQRAPKSVMIAGTEYAINTSYRDCLFTIEQLQSSEFEPEEKLEILINNMYLEDPHDLQEAAEKALWFLRCGEEYKESNQPELCDFAQDSVYIYNAFLKSNINLDDEDMHWWTFMSRFAELPESFFSRLVYLRAQKKKGKLTKDEKSECARIGYDVIEINKSIDRDLEFEKLL